METELESQPKDDGKRRCVPRVQATGPLSAGFSWIQIMSRFLSVLFELGALAFIAYLYSYWQSEPTTQVDILFPTFFPIGFGIVVDLYEIVSHLFLNRRRAVNPVAVGFDVVLIGVGIFGFSILGMVDRGAGIRRGLWAIDMRSAMIFMIVFSIIHAGFIILAAAGIIHIYVSAKGARRDAHIAESQAQMVLFNEMRLQENLANPGPPALVQGQNKGEAGIASATQ